MAKIKKRLLNLLFVLLALFGNGHLQSEPINSSANESDFEEDDVHLFI
jgi:hypothetical protein